MKDIPCKKCGDPIENGFGFCAINSEKCQQCHNLEEECLKCGEYDELKNGRCFMCNETII